MILKYICKYSWRYKSRTLIFLLLYIIITIVLTITAIMQYTSNKYLNEAKEAYNVIMQINSIQTKDYPLLDLDKKELIKSYDSSLYYLPYTKIKPIINSEYIVQYFDKYDSLQGVTPYDYVQPIDTFSESEYNPHYILKIEIIEEGYNNSLDRNIKRAKVIDKLYGEEELNFVEMIGAKIESVKVGNRYYVELYFEKHYGEVFEIVNYNLIDENENELYTEYKKESDYFEKKERSVRAHYVKNLEAIKEFNTGKYYIEGEKFTQNDYELGNEVCIISNVYAEKNNLQVGDVLDISYEWYYSNNKYLSFLNFIQFSQQSYLEEEVNKQYVIKGIYKQKERHREGGYFDSNSIFIPYSCLDSLPAIFKDEHKEASDMITAYDSVTFELVNGDSIQPFLKEMEEKGLDLEIIKFTFYDQGYSHVYKMFNNMKNSSRVLLIGSIAIMIIFNMVMAYLYIIKRKKEIAVLRVLGVSKIKVTQGIILLIIAVAIMSSVIGTSISRVTYEKYLQSNFTTEWNKLDSENQDEVTKEIPIDKIMGHMTFYRVSIISSLLIVLTMTTLSLIQLHIILRKEPLRLLS